MHKSFGKKIKELRLRNDMTQSELGRGLVTPSMISQIEADKASPSHKLLAELAERLGVTLEYFLEDIQTKMEKNGALKYARMLMEAENYKGATQLLKELLSQPVPHLQVADIQLDLAHCLQKLGEIEEALDLYEEIIQDSISQGEPSHAVKALRSMGLIEYQRGNLVLAHFHWTKSANIGLREVRNDIDLLSDVLLLLAKAQNKLGDNADALESLRKVQTLLERTNDLNKLASLSQTFSEVYRDLGLYKKATEYAHDSISIYKNLNIRVQTTYMKIALAQIMDKNGRSDDALRVLEDCLEQADVDVMEDIAYIHSVIASIFFRLERFDAAKAHCEKTLAFADNDFEALIQAYRILSSICLKQEQYPEAVYNCEQLIHFCQKQHRVAELTLAFTLLSDIYKRQGNFMSAAETFLRMQKAVENNLREKTAVM